MRYLGFLVFLIRTNGFGVMTFGILAFGVLDFGFLGFGILDFGALDSVFWAVTIKKVCPGDTRREGREIFSVHLRPLILFVLENANPALCLEISSLKVLPHSSSELFELTFKWSKSEAEKNTF